MSWWLITSASAGASPQLEEGVDETVRSPVYKRASYNSSQIRFDETFVDIVRDDQSEFRCLDFSRFNDTRQR